MIQQVKLMLMTPAFYIAVLVLAVPLLIQLPGNAVDMVQALGTLPPMWEIQDRIANS